MFRHSKLYKLSSTSEDLKEIAMGSRRQLGLEKTGKAGAQFNSMVVDGFRSLRGGRSALYAGPSMMVTEDLLHKS